MAKHNKLQHNLHEIQVKQQATKCNKVQQNDIFTQHLHILKTLFKHHSYNICTILIHQLHHKIGQTAKATPVYTFIFAAHLLTALDKKCWIACTAALVQPV